MKGAAQLAHLCSLISVLVVRSLERMTARVAICKSCNGCHYGVPHNNTIVAPISTGKIKILTFYRVSEAEQTGLAHSNSRTMS